jgi:hypothetical protein
MLGAMKDVTKTAQEPIIVCRHSQDSDQESHRRYPLRGL